MRWILLLCVLMTSAAHADGKSTFSAFCASCHGNGGHGDGPAAAGMNPKPANFHDPARKKRTEDGQVKVVTEGGGANGLSPMMPPFGEILSSDKIREVVKFIRGNFQ